MSWPRRGSALSAAGPDGSKQGRGGLCRPSEVAPPRRGESALRPGRGRWWSTRQRGREAGINWIIRKRDHHRVSGTISGKGEHVMKARNYSALAIGIVVTTSCLLPSPALSTADAGTLDGTWNELTTSGGPPADRAHHSGIYDPVTHKMLIFGGWSGAIYNSLNDTWALDLSTKVWSQISTSGGPPDRRAGHIAVYDSLRHRMVVFSGSNWWTTWHNDTWALDLSSNTWTQLSTTGGPPSKRIGHCGFYDS